MGYPNGPLLRELARRVLHNLDDIDARAPKWDPKSTQHNDPPFSDTQLLISTLGFLVFPHERTPGALGELLKQYEKQFKLADVMTIRYPGEQTKAVDISGDDGEVVTVDPSSIAGLPRLLRNSIAHFNVRPLNIDGRFGGVRVWNTNPDGEITLVADVNFDQLRHLARFILQAFAQGDELPNVDDPVDPLDALKNAKPAKNGKVPKVNRDHWEKALAEFKGDRDAAKTWLDRTLEASLKEFANGRAVAGRRSQQ